MRLMRLLLFALLWAPGAVSAGGPPPIKVVSVRGAPTCRCELPAGRLELRVGDPLYGGDQLRLREGQEITLVFSIGDVVSLTLRNPPGRPTILQLDQEGLAVKEDAIRKGVEVQETRSNTLFSIAHAMTFSEYEYARMPISTAHYEARPVRGVPAIGGALELTEPEASALLGAALAFGEISEEGPRDAGRVVLSWLYGVYQMPHRAWTCAGVAEVGCARDQAAPVPGGVPALSAVWVSRGAEAMVAATCDPLSRRSLTPGAVHAALPGTTVWLLDQGQGHLVVAGPDGQLSRWSAPATLRLTGGGVEVVKGSPEGTWAAPRSAELLLDARLVDEMVSAGVDPAVLATHPTGACAGSWMPGPIAPETVVALTESLPDAGELAALAVAVAEVRRGRLDWARHRLSQVAEVHTDFTSALYVWASGEAPAEIESAVE